MQELAQITDLHIDDSQSKKYNVDARRICWPCWTVSANEASKICSLPATSQNRVRSNGSRRYFRNLDSRITWHWATTTRSMTLGRTVSLSATQDGKNYRTTGSTIQQ